MLCETQWASSGILTHVAVSLYYDDNNYTTDIYQPTYEPDPTSVSVGKSLPHKTGLGGLDHQYHIEWNSYYTISIRLSFGSGFLPNTSTRGMTPLAHIPALFTFQTQEVNS